MKRIIGVFLLIMLLGSNMTAAMASDELSNLQTQAIILIDQNTGEVLYEKNAHQKMSPASTVKLLTALVALDYAGPDDEVTIGNEVLQVPLDASKAGHVPGDQLTMKELLTALLLPSGNDSAFSIASYVIKKVTGHDNVYYDTANAQFAKLMNQKAKEIGATESNFTNPHGYDDPNNYTTASDMALIMREAMNNPVISEIMSTTEYTYKNQNGKEYYWKNRNLLIDPSKPAYYYQYATSGKTGFTDGAGECLVATATKDDVKLIVALYNSPTDARWGEAKTLFDYGFNNFENYTIAHKGDVVDTAAVAQYTKKGPSEIEAVATDDITVLLNKNDIDKIEKSVVWDNDNFVAPIEAGQAVGKVTYSLNQNVLGQVNLVAKSDIQKQTLTEFLFSVHSLPYWGGGIIVIVVAALIIALIRKRKDSRRGRLRY